MVTANVSKARYWIVIILTGATAGVLSGMFGIGGGLIIVPALTAGLKMDHRTATGTSLAAIVCPAAVGVLGYVQHGEVNWLAGLILAVTSAIGTMIGGWISRRVSTATLRWIFVAFLVIAAVQVVVAVPSREDNLQWTWVSALGLVVLGLVAGAAARLVGIGGGMIMVPSMILGFAMSDLIAKGTSLLSMIPASVTGTVGNRRAGTVDLRVAIGVGIFAAGSSYLGVLIAAAMNPSIAAWALAVFMLIMAVRMGVQTFKSQRRAN